MQLHTETLGHVSVSGPSTPAMMLAEEACEDAMLRCRFAKKKVFLRPQSLLGATPFTNEIIYNPATQQMMADIFQTHMEWA